MRWVLTSFFALVVSSVSFCLVGYREHNELQENQRKQACALHLNQIENAKLVWASRNNRSNQDTPKESDLFGPDHFLSDKPVCPSGGVYTIGTVGERPKCSIARHNL